MDRLWALKNDFDPLGRIFLGSSGAGFLFRITRCTVYRCPYCRWIFKITWGPSNSLLGQGERNCGHCKQVFWDGSNEWPEMSSEDRQLFLLPITIAGYIGAFLVIAGLYSYSVVAVRTLANWGDLIFFSALALPIGLWFCLRGVQVARSVHRYNSRVPSRPS
jgi:hypothetical protein